MHATAASQFVVRNPKVIVLGPDLGTATEIWNPQERPFRLKSFGRDGHPNGRFSLKFVKHAETPPEPVLTGWLDVTSGPVLRPCCKSATKV
jgi:hypothetical protein